MFLVKTIYPVKLASEYRENIITVNIIKMNNNCPASEGCTYKKELCFKV